MGSEDLEKCTSNRLRIFGGGVGAIEEKDDEAAEEFHSLAV